MDIVADRVDILDILFDGIGIVETEIAGSPEFLGNTEIHADGFGMAYVKVAVRFGRETRVEASAVFAGGKVVGHDLFNKVKATARFFGCGGGIFFLCHNGIGSLISN